MELFCTLNIFSSTNAVLPAEFLEKKAVRYVKFVDRGTPEFIENRRRVRTRLGLQDASIPRYHWQLCSDRMVEGNDVEAHLHWILDAVRPSKPLFEHLASGYEDYVLALACTGNGLGHGPVLSLGVASLLCRHQVRLELSFYSIQSE